MNIPYAKQDITEADRKAVMEALSHPYLTQGPRVAEFENRFAAYVGSDYAVAVSNGTAALHLSALALGVDSDSRVITTPITFAASANCIHYCGGEVIFADIDPKTVLLDLNKVREKIESSPKRLDGMVVVDFAGYPVNMESFRRLADDYGLWIIEDSCHAPGAYFTDSKGHKQYCGNGKFADLSVFSFHPVKHIACGEGGMITTNSESLYRKLLLLRSHGITKQREFMSRLDGGWYYEMLELGYNYRLPDLLCALGISQLSRAENGILRRQEIALKYDRALIGTSFEIIKPTEDIRHAYHLYVIRHANRHGLYDYLKSMGIFAQIHYIPLTRMPYYRDSIELSEPLRNADDYYDKCLSLPMYPSLTEVEQEYVIETLLRWERENV